MAIIRQSQFQRLASKNKQVLKMEKLRESGLFSINTEKLMDEIQVLHSSRKIRTVSSRDVLKEAQKKLLDVALENVEKRGRCAEIKVQVYRIYSELERKLTDLSNYLMSRYSEQLKAEHRSISDRTAAIQNVLRDFYALLNKLKAVETMADIVIKDCDQTNFHIGHMKDVIQIQFSKERNI